MMRRLLFSLLFTTCATFSATAAVLPESLPSHASSSIFLSAEKNIYQPSFACIDLDSVVLTGHPEPLRVFIIIDLRTGESICLIAPETVYRAILRTIQSPTGLKIWIPIANKKSPNEFYLGQAHRIAQVVGEITNVIANQLCRRKAVSKLVDYTGTNISHIPYK